MSIDFIRMRTPESFNAGGKGKLPGHLGIVITEVTAERITGELPVVESLMAPNGFLHAGSVVTLADTLCGYGCVANLPGDATGFTTIELKSNHLSTALEGSLIGVATPVHRGRTTQVWDATVSHKQSGRTLAVFRCTQLVIYTKPKTSNSAQ